MEPVSYSTYRLNHVLREFQLTFQTSFMDNYQWDMTHTVRYVCVYLYACVGGGICSKVFAVKFRLVHSVST